MSERSKDPMIKCKSVKKDVNEAGKLHVALSLTQAEATTLVEAVTALLDNERGVKLDVHVMKKQTNDGARTFDSAIFFVKPILEYGTLGANGGGAGAKQTFPSSPTKGFVTEDKIAAARAKAATKTKALA